MKVLGVRALKIGGRDTESMRSESQNVALGVVPE